MSLKKKAVNSVLWTSIQQFSTQFISFFVSILLARLLEPKDFGVIALFGILTGIAVLLMSSGMTTSLVRSREVDEKDLSTVFIFNIIVAICLYGIIFLAAPFIEQFYNLVGLTSVIRVYSVIFVIQAFGAVQKSLITKALDFKKLFIIQLPSLVISSIAGIILAMNGFGVWSLVYMGIIQYTLDTLQIWIKSDYVPKLYFDKERFKKHFGFGINLTLTSIINVIFQNIYTIYIGKYLSPTILGFYNRAESLKNLPVVNVMNILKRVLVPLFSSISDDITLKRYYKKILTSVLFLLSPVLVLMIFQAENIVIVLLTEKWIQVVPYLQILCLSGLLLPLSEYNLNVLTVKGRTDLVLKLELYKKIITVVIFAVSIFWGIYGILVGQVVNSIVIYVLNSFYTKKMINYSLLEQVKDVLPYILLSFIASLITHAIMYKDWFSKDFVLVTLTVFVTLSMVIYLTLAKILKLEAFESLLLILKRKK